MEPKGSLDVYDRIYKRSQHTRKAMRGTTMILSTNTAGDKPAEKTSTFDLTDHSLKRSSHLMSSDSWLFPETVSSDRSFRRIFSKKSQGDSQQSLQKSCDKITPGWSIPDYHAEQWYSRHGYTINTSAPPPANTAPAQQSSKVWYNERQLE